MTSPSIESESRGDSRLRFREEALEYHRRPPEYGEALRVSGAWADRCYRGLLALVVVGLVVCAFVRVGDEPLLFVLIPSLRTLLESWRG